MRAGSVSSRSVFGSASATFSATVEVVEQREVLETMPMPSARAALGLGQNDRLALPQDFALGGARRSVGDLDQRRLAGPVFAEQGVDFAARQVEVDAVVGDEVPEPLGDRPRGEQRRAGRVRLPRSPSLDPPPPPCSRGQSTSAVAG